MTLILPVNESLHHTRHGTAELIRSRGPFTSIEDLEIAVAEYVDWFNHRRVHGEIGMVPPVEFEDAYHHENPVPAPAGTALASL